MVILVVSLSFAGERTVAPTSLPAPVLAAIQARLPGAVVDKASKEGTGWEAEVTVAQRRVELEFGADGTWLEESEEIAAATLPVPVLATLDARWKGWTITESERETTPAGVAFDVELTRGKEHAEVSLTEAGVVKAAEAEEGEGPDDD